MLTEEKIDFLRTKVPHSAKLRYFIVGDGKSGTVTCWHSLMKGNSNQRLSIHAHYHEYLWSTRMPILKELQIDLFDLVQYAHQSQACKPLIVYSFREPIGRTISAFFQNFNFFCKNLSNEDKKSSSSVCACLLDNLQSENYHSCEVPSQMGGFDCYSQPFDKERGWSLYETEFARVLFLKFEKIQNWIDAFKAALSEEEQIDFSWRPSHLTKDKSIYAFYQKVKEEFTPTQQALDEKFATHEKFMNHFYTENEIAELKATWYARCQEQK